MNQDDRSEITTMYFIAKYNLFDIINTSSALLINMSPTYIFEYEIDPNSENPGDGLWVIKYTHVDPTTKEAEVKTVKFSNQVVEVVDLVEPVFSAIATDGETYEMASLSIALQISSECAPVNLRPGYEKKLKTDIPHQYKYPFKP